ncbi:hypothetical protein ACPUYX_20195 [Desulfosporosinus sp. SYSU MS00001]|uniref:hypothetical protein n=1 Tax=Desulfosporosinus sp. SYSU MS00001 TaxID=3416284 RepID=UPI003CF1DFCD
MNRHGNQGLHLKTGVKSSRSSSVNATELGAVSLQRNGINVGGTAEHFRPSTLVEGFII